MSSNCICIAVPLSRRWRMKIRGQIPIGGAATRPGGRSAGRWYRNGCGTSAWSWGISCSLIRCAPPSLLLPLCAPHSTAHSSCHWAMRHPQVAAALESGPLLGAGLCAPARWDAAVSSRTRSCSRRSNAEKPMGACAWCMEPASAVVVPVPCASSANGMAGQRQSRARSVCCCIRWWSALPRSSGVTGVEEFIGVPASNCFATNGWRSRCRHAMPLALLLPCRSSRASVPIVVSRGHSGWPAMPIPVRLDRSRSDCSVFLNALPSHSGWPPVGPRLDELSMTSRIASPRTSALLRAEPVGLFCLFPLFSSLQRTVRMVEW